MTQPPPFQIPDNNDRPDGEEWQPPVASPPAAAANYGPPQGAPAFGAPHSAAQYGPPPGGAPTSYGPPPTGAPGPYVPPQGQWPPPAGPASPPPQFGPGQGTAAPSPQAAAFAPQQFPPPAAPGPSSPPPQPAPPSWAGGAGGFAGPAAAGPGVYAQPSPPGNFPPGTAAPGMPPGNYPPPTPASGGLPPNPVGNYPPPAGPPSSPPFEPSPYAMPQQQGFTPPPQTSAPAAHAHDHRHLHLGPPRAPAAPKRKRSPLIPTALVSAIVVVLAVPALVKQSNKDHTGGLGEAQAKAAVQWSIQDGRDGPEVAAGIPSLVKPGAWFSGGNIVVTESGRVVAYNRTTGKTEWEHPAPSGLFVCGAGEQDAGGIAVVAYGTKENCSTIEGVDLAKGDKVWSQTVKNAGFGTGDDIAVSGGTVVVNGQAYSMKDGSALWDSKATFGSSCFGAKYTGGSALVAMGTCKSATSVYAVDPATGKAKWQYDLKSKGSVGAGSSVVSTSPIVVAERPIGSIQEAPTLTVLDDQGKAAFNVTDGHPITGLMEAGPAYLASDKLLFVPGSDMSGSFGTGAISANQIVAVDRATGKTVWTMSVSTGMKAFGFSTQGEIKPVRVDENGDLLALVTGGTGSFKPAHLIRFAAADGKITNLKEYPAKASVAGAFMTETVVREKDGQFFYVGYSRSAEFTLKSAADYPQYRVIAMG